MIDYRRFGIALFSAAAAGFIALPVLNAAVYLAMNAILDRIPVVRADPKIVAGVSAWLFSVALGLFEFWLAYHRPGRSRPRPFRR